MHLAAFLCLMGAVVAQDATPVFRLPDTVLPKNYVLRLEPDLDANTLSGTVMIDLLTTSVSCVGGISQGSFNILVLKSRFGWSDSCDFYDRWLGTS